MKSFGAGCIRAPSSPLLRFLRSQIDSFPFFSPNPRSAISFCSNQPPESITSGLSRKRLISTSSQRRAVVESSVLNLEFLRPTPSNEALFPATSSPKHNIPSPYRPRLGQLAVRCGSQSASKDNRHWPWPLRSRKPEASVRSKLPPLPSFLDDNGGTSLGRSVGKASNELRLRCTEFDENGNVTLVNGEFKKSELIAKVDRFLYCVRFLLSG